jgi:hypothetical protein
MDLHNLSVIRQNFAQCVFTHQVQEAAANRNFAKSRATKKQNIGMVGAVLLVLTVQTFVNHKSLTYIAAALTLIELVLQYKQLNFNYAHEATSHKNSALKYMSLRARYKSLITDVMNGSVSKREIGHRRDELQDEYQSISDLAPQTDYEDYKMAQSKLGLLGGDSEQYTWSDDEIDKFLPEHLRLCNQTSTA